MTENKPLLTISLTSAGDQTTVTLTHLQPVPKFLASALGTHDSILYPRKGPWVPWQKDTVDSGLTMTREMPGPWGLDQAVIWCRFVAEDLARTLAIYEDRPHENVPAYAMQFILNGVACNGWEALDAEFQKLPATTYPLGTFTLTQPTLRVTDPCYSVSTWCTGTLQAKPGRWRAQTVVGPTDWHARNHVLQVHHESLGDLPVLAYSELAKTEVHAGVDSGQCGFFDDALYPRTEDQFEYKGDTFYSKCCNATLDRMLPGGATIEDCGVVTSSGFGDGGYDVYVRRNEEGEVVLALLVFIGDSEEEDDGDEGADDEGADVVASEVQA
jgi:hypothetical protein